jgi:RNA polymerase sigma-70 factor (ECF subfamily)
MDTSEKIWLEYHSRLRAFIATRISDAAARDDILQEVFLKMHTGLTSLKDRTKLKNWLYQITRNAVIDYFRAQKPTVELPESLPQTKDDADAGAEAIEDLSSCLQPMIQNLPASCREAVILSELQGYTQKDVAKMQGISLSGAKSRVQRGRAQLKEMLADCCRLEFDHRGRLSGYEQKDPTSNDCR